MATQETKVCSKCGVDLPITKFSADPTKRDGLYSSCKVCKRKHYAISGSAVKKAHYVRHKTEIREKAKIDYYNNLEYNRTRVLKYQKAHKEQYRAYNREYARTHLYGRMDYRLSRAIRSKMCMAMRGGKSFQSWQDIVGYSIEDLKLHLQGLFKPGMSWANYGEWEIDHIIPRCKFTYTSKTDEAFQKCWALSNLQPLWAHENRIKGGR